jgi:DNA-directed RNA polymerase specialized sigma24 family protein
MVANRYDGVVETWKVKLILNRARRFGLPHDLWPDIQQEIVPDVAAFRFDPARANGAQESTCLTALIDNRLRTFLRGAGRDRRRLEQYRVNRVGVGSTAMDGMALAYDEDGSLTLDVRAALGSLSPLERTICEGLSRGLSVANIARLLDCGRGRVRRMIAGIRQRFQVVGLEDWVRG